MEHETYGGYLGSLHPHQEEALLSMKEKRKESGGGDMEEEEEVRMLRFLRNHDFEETGALNQYTQMLEWRESFGADEIYDSGWSITTGMEEAMVLNFESSYESYYHETDRTGRLVLFDRVGGWMMTS